MLFEVVTRPLIAIGGGGVGWKLWGLLGSWGRWDLFMLPVESNAIVSGVHASQLMLGACMEECTGSELGLRGGISEHC